MQVLRSPVFYVVFFIAVCILTGFHHFVFHPNQYLLSASGDACKNYFTPAWFVANDSGTHFTGMLYPYGENVLYTDAQPALVWGIQCIGILFPGVLQYTVGIMHLAIFISLIICGIFLYKILLRFITNNWVAAIAAIVITIMNPQLERLSGHYALSYACYIPLLWYLHIRMYESERRIKYTLLLIIVITFFAFLHLYYLLTAMLFIGAYAIVQLVHRQWAIPTITSALVAVVVPFFIVYGYVYFTDSTADRPENPYGYTIHRASMNTVFIPPGSLADAIIPGNISEPPFQAEGYAYVGVITLLTLMGVLLFSINAIVFQKQNTFFNNISISLKTYLITGVCILLFAMALPFTWGLENWVEKIPFIRQFRSPGRFAWIFYFISTVIATVFIYRLFTGLYIGKRIIAWILILCVTGVSVYESATYFFNIAAQYNNNPESNFFTLHSETKSTLIHTVNAKDYQAILYVPFFMQGSEKFYIDRSGNEISDAMAIAYQLKLPLMNSMMSRTSFSQTTLLVSLLSHPILPKNLPADFDEKPMLLITSGNNLSVAEKYLVSKAQVIGDSDNLHFYMLPLSAFASTQQILKDSYMQQKAHLYSDTLAGYAAELPLQFFYKNDFEQQKSDISFSGDGALAHSGGNFYLDEIILPKHETFWIEASFWTPLENTNAAFPSIVVEFLLADGTVMATHGVHPKESTDIDAGWVRASGNFEVRSEIRRLRIFIERNSDILIDALVLRHTAADVFYYGPENLFMFNNYRVGK